MCYYARVLLKDYYRYDKDSVFIETYGDCNYPLYRSYTYRLKQLREFLTENHISNVYRYLSKGDKVELGGQDESKKEYIWIPTISQLKDLSRSLLNLNETEALDAYKIWLKSKGRRKTLILIQETKQKIKEIKQIMKNWKDYEIESLNHSLEFFLRNTKILNT